MNYNYKRDEKNRILNFTMDSFPNYLVTSLFLKQTEISVILQVRAHR